MKAVIPVSKLLLPAGLAGVLAIGLAFRLAADDGPPVESGDSSDFDIPVIETGPIGESERGRGLSVESLIRKIESPAPAQVEKDRPSAPVPARPRPSTEVARLETPGPALEENYEIPVIPSEMNPPGSVDAPARGRLNLNARPDREPRSEPTVPLVGPVAALPEEKLGPPAPEELLSWSTPSPVGGADSAARAKRYTGVTDEALAAEVDAGRDEYPPGSPISDGEVDSWRGGYFPTQDDSTYIGDRDYPRSSRGFATIQPDLHSQNFTGIFPYESQDPTFFDQYDYIFDPLDRTLGFFAPHQAMVWEGQKYHELSLMADAGMNIFTRGYDPNRAHVKAGPLYLDLLSLGAGVLYSDYEGERSFPEGEEDGWLSFVDLHIRAVMQFTETFYLIVSGRLIYLPGKNELGIQAGDGLGPQTIARLNYQTRIEQWDLLVYDVLRARFGGDLFSEVDDPAMEWAGRYRFGFADNNGRSNSYFDDESFELSNEAGIRASRPLGNDWRLWLEADHTDYWKSYDFVGHGHRDHLGALIGYEGTQIPFSPYAEYDVTSSDSLNTRYHTAYVGGRGRLSENVRINARGGRFWTADRDPDQRNWVWDVALTHDLNERTRQGVRFGQGFFTDDFTDDSALSEYLSYDVGYRVTEWVYARAYAQWSEDEFLSGREGKYERDVYGGNLDFRLLEYTHIRTGAASERRETVPEGDVDERRIYFAGLTHQLYSRTTLWFRYQFEDAETFDEQLYTAGIRRYF